MKTSPCNKYLDFFFSVVKSKISLEKFRYFIKINSLAQNIDCGFSLEPPRRGGSNEYPQSMFWIKNKEGHTLHRHVIVMFLLHCQI